jgi:hypothetical protein
MVIAAKVETLWALGLRCFPEMMRLFNVYAESIGGAQSYGRAGTSLPTCCRSFQGASALWNCRVSCGRTGAGLSA